MEEIDSLDSDDRHYLQRKAELDNRPYKMYDKIEDIKLQLITAKVKKQTIKAEKITGDEGAVGGCGGGGSGHVAPAPGVCVLRPGYAGPGRGPVQGAGLWAAVRPGGGYVPTMRPCGDGGVDVKR